jgi:hypothetical protein
MVCVFFGEFCVIAEVAMTPQKDLAKFGYLKLHMKAIFLKTHPSIFLANLLEACIEIWRYFFKILGSHSAFFG